jgi:hypothetical protein
LYAWLTAAFFGVVLLDLVYSHSLRDVVPAQDVASVFSEVADTLLCIGGVLVLTAIGAIALSWRVGAARNLLVVSLLIVSFEFLAPVFFSQLVANTPEPTISPWIRLLPIGIASLLAFSGFYKFRMSYHR